MDILDGMALVKSEVATATTLVARTNVTNKPYDDQRVRNALQMAVDNNAVLQLGYGGRGTVGENHHVSPIHPEYYPLPKKTRDAAGAKKLMEEAGQADFEHELITIEDDWQKNTGDAIAAQLRDAGIKVKRTVLPGSRSCAAMASPVFFCQSSSTVIRSCSKSACPASSRSFFAPSTSRCFFGSSAYSGWIGLTWWFSPTVPRPP